MFFKVVVPFTFLPALYESSTCFTSSLTLGMVSVGLFLCFYMISNFWIRFTGTWDKRLALELVRDFPPQRNVLTCQGIMSLGSWRNSRAWKCREDSHLLLRAVHAHIMVLDRSHLFPLWWTICTRLKASKTFLLTFWGRYPGFLPFLFPRKNFDPKETNVSLYKGGNWVGGLLSLSYKLIDS